MPPTAADTYFPLATETATGYHGPELSGEDAGAAGDSSTGVELSHGGLIAIIIVVVVVAILGSEFSPFPNISQSPFYMSHPRSLINSLDFMLIP